MEERNHTSRRTLENTIYLQKQFTEDHFLREGEIKWDGELHDFKYRDGKFIYTLIGGNGKIPVIGSHPDQIEGYAQIYMIDGIPFIMPDSSQPGTPIQLGVSDSEGAKFSKMFLVDYNAGHSEAVGFLINSNTLLLYNGIDLLSEQYTLLDSGTTIQFDFPIGAGDRFTAKK